MKHLKPFIVISVLVTIGLISAYTASIWPEQTEKQISTAETETIDGKQSVGGVASHTPRAKQQTAQTEKTEEVQTTATPTAFEDVAPKQAEIKRSTEVEYEYRALRSSNDPLQQPTWVNSATKVNAAWDTATGNGTIVAVIDSGFALNHEDLTNQWHQNVSEIGITAPGGRCWTGTPANKSSNNCDDDNNGYRDDWRGWDFVNVNNSPQAGEANPNGQGVAHGTEVAGLVGATGNNGVGTATVSWNNKIMPLQALSDDGAGYTSSIAAAVYYAVDNGAKVINMSLGGNTNDPTLALAIKYAFERGVVTVAAAGNCGTGNEQGCDPARPGAMGYPALNPYVIAVGATTSSGARASFSSYGPGLDVSAPGSGTMISPIWHSSNQTSAYATSLYGTSFASPIVASYVGLIKSIRPTSSVDDIIALVNGTAWKPAGMGSNLYTEAQGHGIIDSEVGLRVAGALNSTSSTPSLAQTGDQKSERSYKASSSLSSGCTTELSNAYCTVWAQNSAGYDRYLPYIRSDDNSQAGWTWGNSWLGSGDWALRSRSGSVVSSTPYFFQDK